MAALCAVVAQVPDLPSLGEEGPDRLRRLLSISFVLMVVGFMTGVAGHVIKWRPLVGAGAALVFIGTAVFLVAVGQEG